MELLINKFGQKRICSFIVSFLVLFISYECTITIAAEENAQSHNQSDNQITSYWYGLMKIYPSSESLKNESAKEFCFTYPSSLYTPKETIMYKLKDVTEIDPCENTEEQPEINDKTLYLMRPKGNCSIGNYFNYTKEEHGAGVVLISKEHLSLMNESSAKGLDIVAFINNKDATSILELRTNDSVVQIIDIIADDSFEWSTVLLWIMACFCVTLGSLTGPFINNINGGSATHEQILDGNEEVSMENKNMQIHFSVTLVVILVACISAVLILLHFFYSYLVYFFMVTFCIASGRATFEIIIQILNLCHLDARMPRIRDFGIHRILVGILCTAMPITWFCLRHEPYIWILEDLLGICFCIYLIQTMRIPSLKICSALLSLLFVYDVFFVFITPYITSNGKSIMVEVATGAGTGETLPLLLQLPHIRQGPWSICIKTGFSLLGFGDIILPGFLVCFSHAFDIIKGNKYRPLFATALIGYAVGLAIAFVVLHVTNTGQPALLYIVPCVLLPLYVVAKCKHQLAEMWAGSIRTNELEP